MNRNQNLNRANNTDSKGSENNNNLGTYNNNRFRKNRIDAQKVGTDTANNYAFLNSKEKNDKIDKEKKKILNQKEPKEDNKVFPKESKGTSIKSYNIGNKHKAENDDALEEDIQKNLNQKEPKNENISMDIKKNINENKNKIEDDNDLKEDNQNSSNKKDIKEVYKDISNQKENSEVINYKTQIPKKSKEVDVLKKESQNSSNKKEVNEVNKDISKDIENTDNANYKNGSKLQTEKKDVLEDDKPNISYEKEVKEEIKDTPKEEENIEILDFQTQIKDKDQKNGDSQIEKLINIKKNDKPIKINDNNLKLFHNEANNEKINDIKSLKPAAFQNSKKPKQARYTSTYNRIIKKTEDNAEDIDNNIISEKSRQELSKPGLIGLKNIGATCYMNATLQCFSNCPRFKNNLLKLYKELESGKDSKYKMSFALAEVLKNLWGILYHKYYAPDNFKNIISELNPLFRGIAANDPKDLVLFIIQKIHTELNKEDPTIKTNNNDNSYDFWAEYISFMNFYKRHNNSIITDEFHYYTNNMTTCSNCNTTIHNVQTNNILFLPLEEVRKFKGSFRNIVSIYDCFDYNERQTCSSFHCNICNIDSMAYSCTKIALSAKTLIINLNRGHGMEYDVKIAFEEYLNIRRFVYLKESPYYYELTGVICHFGSNDDGGHFIAYCKNCDDCNWYKFNDGIITKCSFSDVSQKGMHYVLFYSYIQMEE